MGVKISGVYEGGLTMAMTHDLSGTKLRTDPPLDNGGDGKSFSPTDLVATGLASCMMTVMTLAARKESIDLKGMHTFVEKHMSADLPRRINRLDVVLHMPKSLSPEQRARLEHIGNTCPVIQSIHPEIALNKSYHYDV